MKLSHRESEATVAALLETAAQAILCVNHEGRIVLCNAASVSLFGYERQELLGLNVEALVPRQMRKQHVIHRAEFLNQPRSRPMGVGLDLAGVRKDGTEFLVEISLSHVRTIRGPLAIAFVSDITERVRAAAALRESEARLRTLTAALFASQEEERKRVSREFHDDLNQRVAMLVIELAELESMLPASADAMRGPIQNLQTRLTQVSDDLRRTAYQLHPSILEHLGLAAALESYCRDVSRYGNIAVCFKQSKVPVNLPESAALCLFRIAQESLQNVVKHSGAKKAVVELRRVRNELVLTISDRGKGFDPTEVKARAGLGLISMEERARLVNGAVSIVSRPGHGTSVTVRIPLTGAL